MYAVFIAAFLAMHAVSILTSGLPYILGAFITSGAVLGALLILLRWVFAEPPETAAENIGLKKVPFRDMVPGLAVSVALLLAYPLLGAALNTTLALTATWPANLAGTFFTGGIAEEALFRGFLFGRLRRTMSFRRASLISMGVFSLAHLLLFTYLDWPIALLSTLLAVVTSVPLAYLFERGDNTIWSPALVHTTIRTIGMVVTTDQNYMGLAAAWMVCCMVVPYVVLAFSRDFRDIWKRQQPIAGGSADVRRP